MADQLRKAIADAEATYQLAMRILNRPANKHIPERSPMGSSCTSPCLSSASSAVLSAGSSPSRAALHTPPGMASGSATSPTTGAIPPPPPASPLNTATKNSAGNSTLTPGRTPPPPPPPGTPPLSPFANATKGNVGPPPPPPPKAPPPPPFSRTPTTARTTVPPAQQEKSILAPGKIIPRGTLRQIATLPKDESNGWADPDYEEYRAAAGMDAAEIAKTARLEALRAALQSAEDDRLLCAAVKAAVDSMPAATTSPLSGLRKLFLNMDLEVLTEELNRECVRVLVKGHAKRVRTWQKENPTAILPEAEQFVLMLSSPDVAPRVLAIAAHYKLEEELPRKLKQATKVYKAYWQVWTSPGWRKMLRVSKKMVAKLQELAGNLAMNNGFKIAGLPELARTETGAMGQNLLDLIVEVMWQDAPFYVDQVMALKGAVKAAKDINLAQLQKEVNSMVQEDLPIIEQYVKMLQQDAAVTGNSGQYLTWRDKLCGWQAQLRKVQQATSEACLTASDVARFHGENVSASWSTSTNAETNQNNSVALLGVFDIFLTQMRVSGRKMKRLLEAWNAYQRFLHDRAATGKPAKQAATSKATVAGRAQPPPSPTHSSLPCTQPIAVPVLQPAPRKSVSAVNEGLCSHPLPDLADPRPNKQQQDSSSPSTSAASTSAGASSPRRHTRVDHRPRASASDDQRHAPLLNGADNARASDCNSGPLLSPNGNGCVRLLHTPHSRTTINAAAANSSTNSPVRPLVFVTPHSKGSTSATECSTPRCYQGMRSMASFGSLLQPSLRGLPASGGSQTHSAGAASDYTNEAFQFMLMPQQPLRMLPADLAVTADALTPAQLTALQLLLDSAPPQRAEAVWGSRWAQHCTALDACAGALAGKWPCVGAGKSLMLVLDMEALQCDQGHRIACLRMVSTNNMPFIIYTRMTRKVAQDQLSLLLGLMAELGLAQLQPWAIITSAGAQVWYVYDDGKKWQECAEWEYTFSKQVKQGWVEDVQDALHLACTAASIPAVSFVGVETGSQRLMAAYVPSRQHMEQLLAHLLKHLPASQGHHLLVDNEHITMQRFNEYFGQDVGGSSASGSSADSNTREVWVVRCLPASAAPEKALYYLQNNSPWGSDIACHIVG